MKIDCLVQLDRDACGVRTVLAPLVPLLGAWIKQICWEFFACSASIRDGVVRLNLTFDIQCLHRIRVYLLDVHVKISLTN